MREGFMEYTAVKCGNMLPLPRGWVQDCSTLRDVTDVAICFLYLWGLGQTGLHLITITSPFIILQFLCFYSFSLYISVKLYDWAYPLLLYRNWQFNSESTYRNLQSLCMYRFHAALPVSDNRILISGGCSAIGALQDVHIYNIGEFVPLIPELFHNMK